VAEFGGFTAVFIRRKGSFYDRFAKNVFGSGFFERNKNNELRLTTMKGKHANFISPTTPVSSLWGQIKHDRPWESGCGFGSETGIQIRSHSGFSEAGD